MKRRTERLRKFSTVIIASIILSIGGSGCKTALLESGGAYAPVQTNGLTGVVTATSAPDLPLLLTDSAWTLAYNGALVACEFEKANRVLLRTVAPSLKASMDGYRDKIWLVNRTWARARQAYLAHPVPAGLSGIQNAIAAMQQLAAATAATLPRNVPGVMLPPVPSANQFRDLALP